MSAANEYFVFVGTHAHNASEGIYVYRMDALSGILTPAANPANIEDSLFVVLDPSHHFLYAAVETYGSSGIYAGMVSAFSVDVSTGSLNFLNSQSSGGDGACHMSVDATGTNLLVANYGSGTVSLLPIKPDGSLGKLSHNIQHSGSSVDKDRQEGPHAHSITLDQNNKYALATDLGTDQIITYKLDKEGNKLTEAGIPPLATVPGSGPRHLDFHPDGDYVYVINEINSTIATYSYDTSTGNLNLLQVVSALPSSFSGSNTCADIHVSPSGDFLYGSNRGHDSLVIFSIDPEDRTLTYVGHESSQGKVAQNFAIDPTGQILLVANSESGTVVTFHIDTQTGRLNPTGHVTAVPAPACVKLMPVSVSVALDVG